MELSMRELRYVDVLERELNFTRAAAAIPMAQPALSQAITRMERRLGVPLFRRSSRLVEPTVAGALLARRAREILQDVAVAVVDAQLAGGATSLRVHVAEPSLHFARRMLGNIRAEVSVPVHQTTVPWKDVAGQLSSGELALALGPEVGGPGLVSELLREEAVMVLMDQSHPLVNCHAVTVEMIAQHPVVSIDRAMSSWDMMVQNMFEQAGCVPRWTESTAFGAAAAADMVADGAATLLVLESICVDQPTGRVCRPLAVQWNVGWFASYRATSQDLPAVAAATAAAHAAVARELARI